MLRSSLSDYSNVYILASRTITFTGAGADDASKQLDKRNEGETLKNCTPFIDCISEINNTQIDNAKDLDVMMPMYGLIKYSDNYSKTPGRL